MQEVYFNISRWSAWAPNIHSNQHWQLWAKDQMEILPDNTISPIIDNIPAMQLRRLSNLTKMSLKIALECSEGEQIESVFASRYGEWQQTLQLLNSIAQKEETSPAGFSLSVHNAAAGVYSVLSKNTAAYTCLAGDTNTFTASLIEALGRLQNKDKIMLVIAEEQLPPIYEPIFSQEITPYALGLVLCKNEQAGKLKLSISKNKNPPIHALDFLKWFLSGQNNKLQMPLFELAHA